MKKFVIIILSILCCLFFSLGLVACNNENPDNNSGENNFPEEQGFLLTTNIANCTVEGTKIQFVVSNETDSYSFINAFNIPEEYKWELHLDKACLPSLNIVSKSVDLKEGDNVLYALFMSKNNSDDIYLYTIILRREFIFNVKIYSQFNYEPLYDLNVREKTKISELNIEIPQIEHYYFSKFGNFLNATYFYSFEDSITNDCSIYLLYEKESYTVTFKNWDNTTLKVINVQYNEDAEYNGETPQRKTPISSREYYYFIGWDKNLNNIASNIETTAQFEWRYNTVNFQFNQRYNADFNTYENYSISLISASNNDISILYLMDNDLPLISIGQKENTANPEIINGCNIKTVYLPNTVYYLHTNSFAGQSINEIIFDGGVLDWQNGVTKAFHWNATGNDITVKCKDGIIVEAYSEYW